MLSFEFNKLRSDYVYITKLTRSYVYVVCNRDIEAYGFGETYTHLGHEIRKVPIDASVFSRFTKFNSMREFKEPRLATLNFYGDDIISIEIQKYNYIQGAFESPKTWRSTFDKAIPLIEKRIQYYINKGFSAYMNGETIFWVSNNIDEENKPYVNANAEGTLRIYKTKAIKLFRIGATSQKAMDKIRQIAKDSLERGVSETPEQMESDNLAENTSDGVIGADGVVVPILEAKMLAYVPNPQAPKDEQIIAYSPVLESKMVLSRGRMVNVNQEERMAYMLGSSTNPCYVNIDFIVNTAKTIGKLYGNEAMDFLNIPKVLEETGVVNFYNLSAQSRKYTPISRSPIDCIAWILGYIYRETDLKKLTELSKAFRQTMVGGFVRHSDINVTNSVFKKSGEKRVLKARTEEVNKVLSVLHNKSLETHYDRIKELSDSSQTFSLTANGINSSDFTSLQSDHLS